jgi:ferredoxin
MHYLSINKEEWDKALEQIQLSFTIFAAVENDFGIDYEELNSSNISRIAYNRAKPATPLKTFFLPVKENVTSGQVRNRQRVIMGVPGCDVEGLKLLDEIYLDRDYIDIYYQQHRENTVLISFDCFERQEHCHCTSYGINPWSESADLSVIRVEDMILLRVATEKGNGFANHFSVTREMIDDKTLAVIDEAHKTALSKLSEAVKGLPGFETTGMLLQKAGDEIWARYSSRCVSCGACTTICPTCSCFLLIDKPGFEKIRQMDACQYPGFQRVAGGEDSLFELPRRFRNRYMCKYIWKPGKFSSVACTGCGRCIEACIGKINKNELFMELAK